MENVGKYIGENVKRIRLSKNLKQDEVYQNAGLSRITLLNIEKGKSVPNSTNLIKIAKALNVNINELIQKPIKLKSLRYRLNKLNSQKELSQKITDELRLAKWLKNYNFLENKLNDHIKYKLINIKKNKPIETALEVRNILQVKPNEPILNIVNLLEKAGIKVYLYKSSLKQNFGMSLNELDSGPVVAVNTNENITIERQIFTAAHELGHLVLHKDSYNEEIIEENQKEENEANIFASHFLMPNEIFNKKIEEAIGKNWIDIVLHTKRFFKVSYKTVLVRLVENNSVIRDKYNIFQEFASTYKKYYERDLKNHFEPYSIGDIEPEALTKSDFMSDRFNGLVFNAFQNDIITFSKAAEVLDISLEKMKELSKSWSFLK